MVAYGRSIWACGWTCWRQLSMSKVLYSLGGAHTFWISMGAFWLNTIDGREGFQFFCTCRCVGPALQRSSSSGCERNLHRCRAENGDIILRNILRIATHDPGRLRMTMTRASRSSEFDTSSAVGAAGNTCSSTELWRVSRRCFQKM